MSYASGPFAAAPFASESTGDGASALIVDSVNVVDAVLAQEVLNLLSRTALADSLTSASTLVAAVVEALTLSDRLRLILEAVVTDEVVLESLVSGSPVVTTALVDALRLQDLAAGTVSALAIVSDAAALASVLRSIQEADTTDAAELAESLEGVVRAMESIVSGAVFSDTVQGLAVVTVVVPDSLALQTEAIGQAMRLALVEDSVAFSVSFQIDGVPYVGIALNGASRAVTEYTNFDFNSLASFNGTLYGAGAAGLYRLQGADDAGTPIDAYLRTAMQRLAGGKSVRQAEAYIGFRANGELQLKVIVSTRDTDTATTYVKKGYVYDLEPAPRGSMQPGRFKIGRGLKTVYGAYELRNVAGSDFALDVLEIHPLALDRRLP
jgi:hypothetical protein